MKKFVGFICAITLVLLATLTIAPFGFAGAYYEEECDSVFFTTLEEILNEDGKVTAHNEISKELVYDLNLDPLGYIYSITFESSEGYAIVIRTEAGFDVTEIFLDSVNPYEGCSGMKIYPGVLFYLVWENGAFTEVKSGLALDGSALEAISATAFYSADNTLYQTSEIVYYINRVQNEYGLAKRHPGYIPVGVTNGCVPAAGGNIIGYYTRFYPELIPGFTPGSYMANYYLYKEAPGEADAVIQKLHSYMGTNVSVPGTTISGFKSGMTKYCNEKGRSISFTSCMQNGNLNFNTVKQRLEAGLPCVMFLDTFTVATLYDEDGYDVIGYWVGTLCHAMAGFGYREITYTLVNGQTRADKYIAVATGLVSQSKGYFNINYSTQIDELYSINIY